MKPLVRSVFLASLAVMFLNKVVLIGSNLMGMEWTVDFREVVLKTTCLFGWDVLGAGLWTGVILGLAWLFCILRRPTWLKLWVGIGFTVLGFFLTVSDYLFMALGSSLDKSVIDLLRLGNLSGGSTSGPSLNDSILHYINPKSLSLLVLNVVLPLSIFFQLRKKPVLPSRKRRLLAWGAAGILVFNSLALIPVFRMGTFGGSTVNSWGLERNALLTLSASYVRPLWRAWKTPDVTPADPFCLAKSSVLEVQPARTTPPLESAVRARPSGSKRPNLIFVLLESVGQSYLEAAPVPMPFLTSLGRSGGEQPAAVRFLSHQTPWPQTMKSVFSLLCSELPDPDPLPITYVNPAIPCTSLSQTLSDNQYQTAFFTSTDFAFDRQLRFLRDRGFDELVDRADLPGIETAWSNSWGVDERVTIQAALKWMDAHTHHQNPFAFFYQMAACHHPFTFPGGPEHLSDDLGEEHKAYQACLGYVDERLRDLVAGLRERGLLDSSLVVIVSDHGEAFGQHQGRGHGNQIYGESVRVPWVLLGAPLRGQLGLFDLPTNHEDVAPTLLGLLGLGAQVPLTMKGRDLTRDGSPRVQIFGGRPPDEYSGIRDGSWKLIMSATNGFEELYDLSRDPGETLNLAGQYPIQVERLRLRLEEWHTHARMLIADYATILAAHGHRCL